MTSLFESAEFWTSLAFILVIIFASSPVAKGLRKWAEQQAAKILSAEDEARQLFQKAQALKTSYEKAYQNRAQERKKAIQEADEKVAFLEQEIQTKTQEKIHHKKLEVAMRIKNIQENEQQILKTKLLARVISHAQDTLLKNPPVEQSDELADSLCHSLDKFKSVLN